MGWFELEAARVGTLLLVESETVALVRLLFVHFRHLSRELFVVVN
jgi:hypothetical protein